MVAFMCLPKELIPQEAIAGFPPCSINSGPFLTAPHPTLGLPPGGERKLQIQKALLGATGAGRNLHAFQGSPALLTSSGSCPLKEQNLNLVNDC